MHFEKVQTLTEFENLKDDWNHLLTRSASRVPFLRHEYLSTWWTTLGGGEWSQGDLFIVTARQDNGDLCAIAPLFLTENLDGESALMFLGCIEISDYLDFIVDKDIISTFIDELFAYLSSLSSPAWDCLDLYNILDDSLTLQALQKTAKEMKWKYTQEQLQHCPYVPLPGDWDKYLAGIHKKQRHEVRRKIRRAERDWRNVNWYIVDQSNDLDSEIEAFINLMQQNKDKQEFLTDAMVKQMRISMQAAYHAGWLQLAFLEVGGEKAASYLNFDYNNRIWVYNSGMDFRFRSLSPGWVLVGYLLEWANTHQRETFDFLRGDEKYKYRFGGIDRFVVRAKITHS